MRCNHCSKTIPEVSINCPYCKEIVDPNAKPVVNFGELDVTDYDKRFDIKANNYEEIKEEKKKMNPFVIGGIAVGSLIVVVLIVALVFGNSTPSGYTYFKGVNDELFTFLLDNYTGSNDTTSGSYDFYLKINEDEYEFEGDYGIDTKNKIVKLTGEYLDPRIQAGQIVVDSDILKFDAYLQENYFYLLSEQIYDRDVSIMLPIDDETGLLKTKKYNLESLINGVHDAIDFALSKVNYEYKEDVEINHLGELVKAQAYTIVLDNAGKKEFFTNVFQTLLDDGSFINDYAKIQDISSSEAESIFNNYLTSIDYKYSGESEYVTNLTIYFDGYKIYRLEADFNEKKDRLVQIEVGETKYYFEYFNKDKNIYSGSLKFSSEEEENYIQKDYEITFDSDKYITDMYFTLYQDKNGKVKKKEVKDYKNIQEFKEEDYKTIKANLGNFFNNVNWVDNLEDIFKEKCTPALKCECKVNSKYCNCNYNGEVIVCPIDDVKKDVVTTTTTTAVNGSTTTLKTSTTTTNKTITTTVINNG